jgi:hypothetical protein
MINDAKDDSVSWSWSVARMKDEAQRSYGTHSKSMNGKDVTRNVVDTI